MLGKIKEKKLIIALLCLVVFVAILVRTYNYHDWLFFKYDQARDATLLSQAIENGPEYLPLLGPRAAKSDGDYLRLGPAYYYTQYISGALFKSTKPDVFAYPDLFFSILTIPLFYMFLRLYFTRKISLLSATLYASSFIIIQHSRFSWNPNSVPFFMLLSLYGLLKFTVAEKFKSKLGWISLWAFGFAIASQYHFFALFSLSATSVVFFCLYIVSHFQQQGRLKFPDKSSLSELRWKLFTKDNLFYALATFLIILFFYFPVILSEVNTGWNNTKRFISVVADRSDVDADAEEADSDAKTFSEKLVRNFREQAKGYSLIAIGKSHREGKKADPITVTFGTLLLFGSLILATRQYMYGKNTDKRNYLLIIILWSGLFFVITIPNSYQLRPRYFAPVFPVPFIMLALWFSFLGRLAKDWQGGKFKKYYWPLTIFIALIFFAINCRETALWFKEQADSQEKSIEIHRTLILKRQDGITLGQLERAVNFMYDNKSSKHVIFYAKPEYKTPLKYLFDQKKDPELSVESIENPPSLEGQDVLFAVVSVRGGEDSVKKDLQPYLENILQKQIGQILVLKMKIDKEKLPVDKASKKDGLDPIVDNKIPRLFWKDFVGEKNNKTFNELRGME